MALRLQFETLIIPRANFARCRGLPRFLSELNPASGILLSTNWYDQDLYCETAMNGLDTRDSVERWEAAGLVGLEERGGTRQWKDFCVAASGLGPVAACAWLDYDPQDNCVWLKGGEKGAVIGGMAQVTETEEALAALSAKGERAYDVMYDSRHPKDDYEDASAALNRALSLAVFLHRGEEAQRLTERIAHIRAVYQSQFRSR